MSTRTIKVDALARVEGEGAMYLKLRGKEIQDLKFSIYEPPRFYEAFLRGRDHREVPDITARICGICPIAYMMGANQAMEDALGVAVDGPLYDLRRLIYCGEWIQSHVLHVYMLHAPDFLGYQSSLDLAKDHPQVVETGLKLKKIGNEIMEVVGGGRSIHPVNLRVGGFYKVPRAKDLRAKLEDALAWGVEASKEMIALTGGFEFPRLEQDYTFLTLSDSDEYAITRGTIKTNTGIDVPVRDFLTVAEEEHVAHSNALHGVLKDGGAYMTGPMARYAINYAQLSPTCQDAAKKAGLGEVVTNPFQSIVVRSVETLYAYEEALRIVRNYEEPDSPWVEYQPRAGTGHGATEAPRGLCYHTYSIDDQGYVESARIIPPTSQNQKSIESDLYKFVSDHLDLPDDELQWKCEQAIRNYDPCISCATHFLKLTVDRE